MSRRPRIGTVLLLFHLIVLALPLSGIWVLRLYESALLRQTESELIAQGAVVAAAFRTEWRAAGGGLGDLGPPVEARWAHPPEDQGPWQPRFASLDLAEDPILPEPPAAAPAPIPAGAAARAAGERITTMLRDAQRVTLAGVRVVDRRGVVVATTREELGQSLAAREEVSRALAGEALSLLRHRYAEHDPPNYESISRGSSLRVFCALPILEGERVLGAVVLSRTPRTIVQSLYGKRWHLLGLAVLLLGAVGTLAVLGALTIARPLRAVTAQAKQIADGALGPLPRIDRPTVHEVAELSDALARMAATLEHRADYIQSFAAQVSHEFKTPLASIRGTVELLRDHLDDMTAEQRGRFLSNLDADADRLDRLVRRLLELARADVRRSPAREHTDLTTMLDSVAERYRGTGMTVVLERTPSSLWVGLPAETVETVLRNLLDNIRQHGGPAARALLSLRRDSDAAVLRVADDGPGISPANAARIFDRFFTTARPSGGTGLGLAIVQSLLTAHHATITLIPGTAGAVFELRLPMVVAPCHENGNK